MQEQQGAGHLYRGLSAQHGAQLASVFSTYQTCSEDHEISHYAQGTNVGVPVCSREFVVGKFKGWVLIFISLAQTKRSIFAGHAK